MTSLVGWSLVSWLSRACTVAKRWIQGHSYYGTLIGNSTPGIQWYNFRPPGVTPNRGMGPPWGAFCQITLTSCWDMTTVWTVYDRWWTEDGKPHIWLLRQASKVAQVLNHLKLNEDNTLDYILSPLSSSLWDRLSLISFLHLLWSSALDARKYKHFNSTSFQVFLGQMPSTA